MVYPIYYHSHLGYLVESYVVQLSETGRLSFRYQNISSKNWEEFAHGLGPEDIQLINWTDEIQQDSIYKRFNTLTKRQTPSEFLLRVFDDKKGEPLVQTEILNFIERRMSQLMPLLRGKLVFEMGTDGNPVGKEIKVGDEVLQITFRLERRDSSTIMEPIVTHKGQRLKLYRKNMTSLKDSLGWVLLDRELYQLPPEVKSSQLRKFTDSYEVQTIPSSGYPYFYGEFLPKRLASQTFECKGVEVKVEQHSPHAVIYLREVVATASPVSLFAESGAAEEPPSTDELTRMQFTIKFAYGSHEFEMQSSQHQFIPAFVKVNQRASTYSYLKLPRNPARESELLQILKDTGLQLVHGRMSLPKGEAQGLIEALQKLSLHMPIRLAQQNENGKRYFLGASKLQVSIQEQQDWFELRAVVMFGPYEIPFYKLRKYIVQGKEEFELPNGEIAIIPDEWFKQYQEVFSHANGDDEQEEFMLGKQYLSLVHELQAGNLAQVTISERLQRLREFTELEEYELPERFNASLRPYQKAGYDWLMFLNSYRLGGCLADDMGLGKTVQTLAMLAKQQELHQGCVSLLVMPTSLVYNWQKETARFAPHLRVLDHTGTNRERSRIPLEGYHLVITSYGTLRSDIELFANCYFHYVILDESQAIKNPSSIVSKAVLRLRSTHKLILTGTPMENSTMDLWSQMNFVNPGLLGSQGFFRKQYLVPIEKKSDDRQKRRLHALIKPFILRRNKSQVATELPVKSEQVLACGMTDEQSKLYEEAKNMYRNEIMGQIETMGMARSRMVMLRGLTRLRQLANHPAMVDPDYTGSSGKLDDVFYKIEDVVSEDHKILVFSQFVRHLTLLRKRLDADGIRYSYLDGATRDRQQVVEEFQSENGPQVFLISLKAGGVGLNLTAADYVFILDPWWNPAVEAQAVDRAHRIGQEKPVFTYKFITQNTVEEKILALQERKKMLINDIISTEESFVKSLTVNDIAEILG